MSQDESNEERYLTDDNGQMSFTEYEDSNDRLDATVPVFISKANEFIKRIGKTTLLSEQALLVAIYKAKPRSRESIVSTRLLEYYDDLKKKTGTDFSEGLIATFTSAELKKLMNIKTSRYSAQMEVLMNQNVFTNSWHILYNKDGKMADTACVTGSLYDKKSGRVTIKFNSDIIDRIINIKTAGGYTNLNRKIMCSVSKDLITWSIYQLLREEISYWESINKKRGLPPKKEYVTEFGFSEFKFLTTVNQVDLSSTSPDQIACANLIKERNYEEAEQVLPKDFRMYDQWKPFRARVLTRACAVINGWKGDALYDEEEKGEYESLCTEHHATDIHFRYVPVKSGQGLKVVGIRFYIRWDSKMKAKKEEPKPVIEGECKEESAVPALPKPMEVDAATEMQFIAELSETIDIPMKVSEMRKIALASRYSMERIKTVYNEIRMVTDIITSDSLIARLVQENTVPSLDEEKFPGFSMDELETLYHEAVKHVPSDFNGGKKVWADKYTAYYRDKIQDDPDGTKTTVFKRLMDCLRKDYDGLTAKKEVPSNHKKKRQDQDFMQRDYTEMEIFLLEVKKGVRKVSDEFMKAIEADDKEKIKEMYARISVQE